MGSKKGNETALEDTNERVWWGNEAEEGQKVQGLCCIVNAVGQSRTRGLKNLGFRHLRPWRLPYCCRTRSLG